MQPVVVVDGSNVIHANVGSRKLFRVERIRNVIAKLNKLGYAYKIGMKSGTFNYIIHHASEEEISESDKKTLQTLADDIEISLLNSDKDDRWIHLAAIEFDGYILSHDRFRDEIQQWKDEGRNDIADEIITRRVDLEFFDDSPIFTLPSLAPLPDTAVPVKDTDMSASSELRPDAGPSETLSLEEVPETVLAVETEIDAEESYKDGFAPSSLTAIANANGSDKPEWKEIELPINTPLGRKLFAELLGIDDATRPLLGKISRHHFEITAVQHTGNYELYLRDLNSTNGTQFGGVRVGNAALKIPTMHPRLGRTHPDWSTVFLGSQLLELRLGATLVDIEHPCFNRCNCDFITG